MTSTAKKSLLAVGVGIISIAGVILQLTGFDVIGSIETLWEQLKGYLATPEANGLFMSALTVLNAYTLTANKLAQLKVADGQVQMMSQNIKIVELGQAVAQLAQENQELKALILQSANKQDAVIDMVAVAFNQSRISDTAKQYIEKRRLSVAVKESPKQPTKNGKEQPIVEQVVETLPKIEEVLKTVVNLPKTLADKIHEV